MRANHLHLMARDVAIVALGLLACAEAVGATRVVPITFLSHDAQLSGSIALPTKPPVHAAVVFVHGAGKQARGVGESGGEYEGDYNVSEKNLSLLADDAAAALKALAAQPVLKGVPVGVTGFSQGGWIAPLAAALAARKEPAVWPAFLGRDTDSAEDLKKLSIPGLWLFGDRDGSIPVDLSIKNLRALKAAGHRYDYALFSGQGHDNIDATFATVVGWIKRQPRATASMLLPSGSSTNPP